MPSGQVAILLTGSELLDGRVFDTNSHYLCQKFAEIGIEVSTVLTCDDKLSSIVSSLQYLSERAHAIIISGGLGPTTDDLTREAVSSFTGAALVLNEEILTELKGRYEKRGRVLSPTNTKQALIPEGGDVVPNPVGTAAGFSLRYQGADGKEKILYTLPGVPHELKAMFEITVFPSLTAFLGHKTGIRKKGFRLFGIPESVVGHKIEGCKLPEEITVSYRAALPEIHVILKTSSPTLNLDSYFEKVKEAVGKAYIFTEDLECNLPTHLHHLFLEKKLTIAVAESCTGGLVGGLLTECSGSSEYFLGGVISYSNELKQELLGVRGATLTTHGAVSVETAREMAIGVRERCGSAIGLSVTGISGPTGGSEEKPVGTFFVGIADEKGVAVYHYLFINDRQRARRFEAYAAIEVVRRRLLGIVTPPDDFCREINVMNTLGQ